MRIARYRANATVEERQQIREIDRINGSHEGMQLGDLFMIHRGQLLLNSDSRFILAHLILAIVVPDCATIMVGHSLMVMTLYSTQYMIGN